MDVLSAGCPQLLYVGKTETFSICSWTSSNTLRGHIMILNTTSALINALLKRLEVIIVARTPSINKLLACSRCSIMIETILLIEDGC